MSRIRRLLSEHDTSNWVVAPAMDALSADDTGTAERLFSCIKCRQAFSWELVFELKLLDLVQDLIAPRPLTWSAALKTS